MPETQNEIALYETETGKIKISVLFENENLWLSQKLMLLNILGTGVNITSITLNKSNEFQL